MPERTSSSNGNGKSDHYGYSYRRQIAAFAAGNFFTFPYDFLWVFPSLHEAVVMADLANHADKTKSLLRKKGWFYYTMEDMRDNIRMDPQAQRRTIQKLVALGVIETMRLGVPPKRHFRIKIDVLNRLVEQAREQRDRTIEVKRRRKLKELARKVEEKLCRRRS